VAISLPRSPFEFVDLAGKPFRLQVLRHWLDTALTFKQALRTFSSAQAGRDEPMLLADLVDRFYALQRFTLNWALAAESSRDIIYKIAQS
jgi:hypothetical protein